MGFGQVGAWSKSRPATEATVGQTSHMPCAVYRVHCVLGPKSCPTEVVVGRRETPMRQSCATYVKHQLA